MAVTATDISTVGDAANGEDLLSAFGKKCTCPYNGRGRIRVLRTVLQVIQTFSAVAQYRLSWC